MGLFCLIAYGYVFPYQAAINNPNENSRFYMTAAMVEEGTYRVDTFRDRWGWVNDCAIFEGHYYSVKAPGTSFLGIPAYALYRFWVNQTGATFDRVHALYVCRMFGTILPWLLFLGYFYRRLGAECESPLVRDAIFMSIAFGSCLYGYALLFVSHSLSAAAAFVAFMLLLDARRAGRMPPGKAFAAGLLTASVTFLEYPGLIVSLMLSAFALVAVRSRSGLWAFAWGGLIPTLLMMHFQAVCFGSPFSPGHLHMENPEFRGIHEQGMFGATEIHWEAYYGLLLNPGKGLLPLTPILLFGFLGAVKRMRQVGRRWEGAICFGVPALTMAVISLMIHWNGGWVIGPRYLVVAYPFLAWSAVAVLDPWMQRFPRMTAGMLVGATVVAFVLSGVPSAYYPHYPIAVERPVSQVVRLFIAHDYAPYNLFGFFGVYGTLSMVPLACAALACLCWLLMALRTWRAQAVALVAGLFWALPALYLALLDPQVGDPEIANAQRVILSAWRPEGFDRAARLEQDLRSAPREEGFNALEDVYRAEGRLGEAQRTHARGYRFIMRPPPSSE